MKHNNTKHETQEFRICVHTYQKFSMLSFQLKMNTRPRRRCSSRQNYHELADVKIPVLSKTVKSRKVSPSTSSDTKLYRLNVIDKDDANGCVKVRYIGYGEEYDE